MKILFLATEATSGVNVRRDVELVTFAAHVARLEPVLCPGQTELAQASRALSDKEEIHVILADIAHGAFIQELLTPASFCLTSLLLCSERLSTDQKSLLTSGFARHLIPKAEALVSALLPTFHRLTNPGTVPLGRTLGGNVSIHSALIRQPSHLSNMGAEIEEELGLFAQSAGPTFRSTFIPRVQQVIDEIFTNALVVTNGSDDLGSFLLARQESIQVEWGFNGEAFGLRVTDRKGALLPWTFLRSAFGLPLDGKPGPANVNVERKSLGIGLQESLSISRELSATVAPRRFTQIDAMVPYERSLKAFELSPKRVEFFSL